MSENTSLSVLVIEDDSDYAHLLSAFLKRSGHKVSVAQDGVQGQRVARLEQPDVITMDHRLPGGLGTAVSRRLRDASVTASIPIIMLTGSPVASVQEAARDAGVSTVLCKSSLTEKMLVEAIERAVAHAEIVESPDAGGLFPAEG